MPRNRGAGGRRGPPAARRGRRPRDAGPRPGAPTREATLTLAGRLERRRREGCNCCHQDELRRAVSTTTGTRFSDVVGVSLGGLAPDGVEVCWVDTQGSHASRLAFPTPARTTAELGEMLRRELHAGLC